MGGNYGIVGVLRVGTDEAIAEMVTSRMVNIEGIENTGTMIAFKTCSRHDLEQVFSVGMELSKPCLSSSQLT